MSHTFTNKTGTGGSLVDLFSLTSSGLNGVQYFHLTISGYINNIGAYGETFSIWVYSSGLGTIGGGNTIYISGFNNIQPSICTLTHSTNSAIIKFQTPTSNTYYYCATLTAYPTFGGTSTSTDWAVTAL